MTFMLKNKELQKQLEAIGGEQNVKKAISEYEENDFGGAVFSFSINDKFRITVGTTKDEIEEVPEYNPHAWNDFPTVPPPENVPMRIEVKRIGGKDHGSTFPFYGYFKDSEWIVLIRRSINKLLKEFSDFDPTYDKIRFRPWND